MITLPNGEVIVERRSDEESQVRYALLVRLDERVSNFILRFDAYVDQQDLQHLDIRQCLSRLEARIILLERWRWGLVGASSAIAVIVSILLKIFWR